MIMTREDLKAAGEALYGEQWKSPLARDLGMSVRHLRRLAAGTEPIFPHTAAKVGELIQARIRKLEKLVA